MPAKHLRKEIIPDLNVKLLNICLDTNDSEIALPATQRENSQVSSSANSCLESIIFQKIEDANKNLPLVLRKRKLYENSLKNIELKPIELKISQISSSGIVPIMLRKYLLYKEARAS